MVLEFLKVWKMFFNSWMSVAAGMTHCESTRQKRPSGFCSRESMMCWLSCHVTWLQDIPSLL